MAKLLRITSKNPRRKKWEHFKLKFRIFLFRISVVLNLSSLIYLLNQDGYLTNIIKMVSPIFGSLFN